MSKYMGFGQNGSWTLKPMDFRIEVELILSFLIEKRWSIKKYDFLLFCAFLHLKRYFQPKMCQTHISKKIENRQKFDFPKMVSKYVLISKFCRKWFFEAQRAIFEQYFTFLAHLDPWKKIMIWGSKSHFHDFSISYMMGHRIAEDGPKCWKCT